MNLSIMKGSKTSRNEKDNKRGKMKRDNNNKRTNAAIGRTTMSKARRSTNKTKTSNRMKETLKTCGMKNSHKNFPMNKVMGRVNHLGRLYKMKMRWTWKMMVRIASSLKSYRMRMIKGRKTNRFKLKTINSQWRNNHNNPMKKRKRNKQKIENNMRELMEGKIISLKTIILCMIRKLMISKTWDKVKKMLKAQDKDKKVLANLSILSGSNSFKKS